MASSLVAAALVAGIAGTTWGLVVAKRETERARDEERKVRDEQGRTQLAREAAELNLVRSYLRPIGYNTNAVDQAELVALNELAGLEDDRLKLLFLRESLADGDRALRIARRAERVIQAAIGTSLKRRAAAIELMSARQRDKGSDPCVRLAACWLAIELGSDDILSLDGDFETFMRQRKFSEWPNILNDFPGRIHPTQRVRLFAFLTSLVGKAKLSSAPFDRDRDVMENTIVSLAPQLDAVCVNQGFITLLSAIDKTSDALVLAALGMGIEALAPKLDSVAARQGFDALLSIFENHLDYEAYEGLGRGLTALALRLDAVSAKRGIDALFVRVLPKITDGSDGRKCETTGDVLAALTTRLDTVAAKQAFDNLLILIGKRESIDSVLGAVKGLVGLGSRLDAITAKQAMDALIILMNYSDDSGAAAYCLAMCAQRLDADAVKQYFDALLSLTKKYGDPVILEGLANALAALADRVDAESANQAYYTLLSTIRENRSQRTINGLSALASRLDLVELECTFHSLLSGIDKPTNTATLLANVYGLVGLAPHLDADSARQSFHALLIAIRKEENVKEVGIGLAAFAPRLDASAAKEGFDSLLMIIKSTKDIACLRELAKGVAALAPRLDAATAKHGFDASAKIFSRQEYNVKYTWDEAISALAALASRMDAVTAKQSFDTYLSSDEYSIIQQVIIISALIPRLNSSLRSSHSAMALNHLLAACRLNSEYVPDDSVVDQLVGMIDSAEDLTNLLRDPACLGPLKDAVLLRLEELAYPNPTQAAAFVGMGANANSAIIVTAVKAASDEKRKFDRRFRTVSDAAQWLAEHHPEIDLDRPYRQNETGK